jgi:hypothetical protein
VVEEDVVTITLEEVVGADEFEVDELTVLLDAFELGADRTT